MREEDGRNREFASRDVEDCPRPLDKQRGDRGSGGFNGLAEKSKRVEEKEKKRGKKRRLDKK